MERTIHDVFISYSRKDYVDEHKNVIPDNEVSKIKDALTEVGITYWFDEEGIYSGQNFVEKIVTNIENAKIFLFLSTANANKSPWTCKEIASADEFKKHIIPVRIDTSPYNKKVLFRIADLDYIEYYTNPQKGIKDLIKSIKTYLDELAAEERRKKEEENKRKETERKKEEELRKQREQEEIRRQEAQKRLVSEIKISCATLNNKEAQLELERENLLLRTEKVSDSSLRDGLKQMIKTSGTIHQKYQTEYLKLTKEIKKLRQANSEVTDKDKQNLLLKSNLQKSEVHVDELKKAIKRCRIIIPALLVLTFIIYLFPQYCPVLLNKEVTPGSEVVMPEKDSLDIHKELEFSVKGVSFIMLPVQGGTFTMEPTLEETYVGEKKKTKLSSFYIGQTEVTQALWEVVMGDNPSEFKGSNRPVEMISWNDCQKFITKLDSITGKQFRLPTKTEWMYAAHGGNKSKRYKYSGNDSILAIAWYCGNSNNKTHDVAKKSPNELGIYDMSGNVWEWCQDTLKGGYHVHCGGSWFNYAENCQSTSFYSSKQSNRYNFLGFRLVLSKDTLYSQTNKPLTTLENEMSL